MRIGLLCIYLVKIFESRLNLNGIKVYYNLNSGSHPQVAINNVVNSP